MKFFLSLPLTFLFFSVTAQPVPSIRGDRYMIVGTYDSPKSEGIYVYSFNSKDGSATAISHVKTPNPSFLAISPDEKYVYAVHETAPQDGKGGEVAAFTFNKQTGTLTLLNKQLSGGDHPCHVEVDKTGKWVFVSNYSSGSLSVLPVNADGSLGTATTIQHKGSGPHTRQKGPHVHSAIMSGDNKQLMVSDLGIDKVMVYSFDAATGKLAPSGEASYQARRGSGPRHFTFHPNNKYAYVIEELIGNVSVFDYTNRKLEPWQLISSMTKHDTSFPGSADIHVSPDGKFVYASNRGDVNNIAIYRVPKKIAGLTLVAHQSTLGKTPRNFSIDPSGKYLLCGNQNSDEIVVFKRNKKTGLLTDSGKRILVGKPVCIKWVGMK